MTATRDRSLRLDAAASELRVTSAAIRVLRDRFAAAFSDPPLHLVWANGRGLLWRTRGRNSSEQRLLALTDPAGANILNALPLAAREALLHIEAERQELMLRHRLLSYECRQLRQWLRERQALQRLAKPLRTR